jgi:hypothetical protein
VALIVVGGYALASSVFAQEATPVATDGTPVTGGTPDTGGPVTVATPGPAATPTGLTILRFVEHADNQQTIDLGDPGDTMGDLLVFANSVFDETDTTQVGTDQGSCVRTVPGQAWECSWTVFLDGGQLSLQGTFSDTGDGTFTVTGGTDNFLGASGQLTMAPRPNTTNEYDMTFELL